MANRLPGGIPVESILACVPVENILSAIRRSGRRKLIVYAVVMAIATAVAAVLIGIWRGWGRVWPVISMLLLLAAIVLILIVIQRSTRHARGRIARTIIVAIAFTLLFLGIQIVVFASQGISAVWVLGATIVVLVMEGGAHIVENFQEKNITHCKCASRLIRL